MVNGGMALLKFIGRHEFRNDPPLNLSDLSEAPE
jgi:hypothetical protein